MQFSETPGMGHYVNQQTASSYNGLLELGTSVFDDSSADPLTGSSDASLD